MTTFLFQLKFDCSLWFSHPHPYIIGPRGGVGVFFASPSFQAIALPHSMKTPHSSKFMLSNIKWYLAAVIYRLPGTTYSFLKVLVFGLLPLFLTLLLLQFLGFEQLQRSSFQYPDLSKFPQLSSSDLVLYPPTWATLSLASLMLAILWVGCGLK